jgi:hypothetical protein
MPLVEPYFSPPPVTATQKESSWVPLNQEFRQEQKNIFFRNAIDYLVENGIPGSYFEFGCHKARTFRMAAMWDKWYADNKGAVAGGLTPQNGGGYFEFLLAFDSFQGLPADSNPSETKMHNWQAQSLTTSEDEFLNLLRNSGLTTDRVVTIPGFYSISLNEATREFLDSKGVVASLVTLDCDLYESYQSALKFSDDFLTPGCVIYLDDWNTYQGGSRSGPKKAWAEFVLDSKNRYLPFIPQIGWWGTSFIVDS